MLVFQPRHVRAYWSGGFKIGSAVRHVMTHFRVALFFASNGARAIGELGARTAARNALSSPAPRACSSMTRGCSAFASARREETV